MATKRPNLRKCRACGSIWSEGEVRPCQCAETLRWLCGAKLRGKDALCRREVRGGGERCYRHGGRAARGAAQGNFKHGRYSKLPERYVEAYARSLEDPKQLSLVDAVGLLDARADELLGRLSTGESGERWKDVRLLAEGGLQALAEGSTEAVERIFVRLGELADAGVSDDETWQDIESVLKHRRESVDVEVRRLKAEQGSVPAETVIVLIAGVTDLVRTSIETAVRIGIASGASAGPEAAVSLIAEAQHAALAAQLRKLAGV